MKKSQKELFKNLIANSFIPIKFIKRKINMDKVFFYKKTIV